MALCRAVILFVGICLGAGANNARIYLNDGQDKLEDARNGFMRRVELGQ